MVPTFANALYNRGIARRNLGDPKGAITDFDAAQSCGMDTATLYHNRGVAHADLGDYQTALAQYQQAIERNDKLADVFHSRAMAHRQLGDEERAATDLLEYARLTAAQGND